MNASYFEFGEMVFINIAILPGDDQDVTYRVNAGGKNMSTIEPCLIVSIEKNVVSGDPMVTVVSINACSQESPPVTKRAVPLSEF